MVGLKDKVCLRSFVHFGSQFLDFIKKGSADGDGSAGGAGGASGVAVLVALVVLVVPMLAALGGVTCGRLQSR